MRVVFRNLLGNLFGNVQGFRGIGDAGGEVGVNGGEGAEEKAIDVSEHRCAAGRDAVGGEKRIEIAKRKVDSLGGLEALRVPDEIRIDVRLLVSRLLGRVATAESRVRIQHDGAALAATGVEMRAASRKRSEVDLGFHFDPVLCGVFAGRGYPTPGVFCKESRSA